jgi:hypothetical protein
MDLGGPTRIASCLALVSPVFVYQSQRSVRQKDHPGKISQEGHPTFGCASKVIFHGFLLGMGAGDAFPFLDEFQLHQEGAFHFFAQLYNSELEMISLAMIFCTGIKLRGPSMQKKIPLAKWITSKAGRMVE